MKTWLHDIPDGDLRAFLPDVPGMPLHRFYKGGGGGGDAVKYDNLEKLYAEQTENARMLREISQQYLPGAMQNYMGRIQETQNPDYVNAQTTLAAADMAKANAMERQATERQLASTGVNASDPRFAGSLRQVGLSNAARMAAGVNSTRDAAKRYQLSTAQDAIGTMTGTNNSAAAQMGSATSGLSSLYSNQQQLEAAKAQQQSNNIANAVGGAYSMLMRDGGRVVRGQPIRRLAGGGIAGGGLTGGPAFSPLVPPAAPAAPPQQPGAAPYAGAAQSLFGAKGLTGLSSLPERMAAKSQNIMKGFGKAADFFGATDTAREINNYAQGMTGTSSLGSGISAASSGVPAAGFSGAGIQGTSTAAGMEGALGTGISQGAEMGLQAGSGLAGAAAEGTGALTGALGAVSTALPWVGAAAAIGSMFDLFADGGKVKDLREDGGEVPGQWRGNTDTVPALLTEDEHVINAEAAALAGHDKLDALNRQGLSLRQAGKTPRQIERLIGMRT